MNILPPSMHLSTFCKINVKFLNNSSWTTSNICICQKNWWVHNLMALTHILAWIPGTSFFSSSISISDAIFNYFIKQIFLGQIGSTGSVAEATTLHKTPRSSNVAYVIFFISFDIICHMMSDYAYDIKKLTYVILAELGV